MITVEMLAKYLLSECVQSDAVVLEHADRSAAGDSIVLRDVLE